MRCPPSLEDTSRGLGLVRPRQHEGDCLLPEVLEGELLRGQVLQLRRAGEDVAVLAANGHNLLLVLCRREPERDLARAAPHRHDRAADELTTMLDEGLADEGKTQRKPEVIEALCLHLLELHD